MCGMHLSAVIFVPISYLTVTVYIPICSVIE